MISLIDAMLTKKDAYKVDGSVYLDISRVKDFGILSRLTKEEMIAVAKDFDEDLENLDKRHPLDITLWRSSQKDQPVHIPSFDSPYGKGRPGWHIECSAMGIKTLGEQITIHGGGIDLIFPHHECEIAQSESATGKVPFAKYWVHTREVFYKGEKMSKSKGNLVMVSDLLKTYSPNAVRYLLLTNHYRTSWEYEEEKMNQAGKDFDIILERIKNAQGDNSGTFDDSPFFEAVETDLHFDEALLYIKKTVKKEMNKNTAIRITELMQLLGFNL